MQTKNVTDICGQPSSLLAKFHHDGELFVKRLLFKIIVNNNGIR